MSADFGERLRQLRRAAGASQVELAGDQLSPSYISLLEAGKRHPSEEVIALLAGRLRCSIAELINPVTREQSQRAQLELSFARLAMANGETDDARTRLETLLPEVLSDPGIADQIRFLLAEVYWRAGEAEAAIQALLPVYEHCLARVGDLPLATVGLRLTMCYLEAGDLQAAVRHGESALAAMSDHGLEDTDEYLRAAATLVGAYYELGDLAHATIRAAAMIERAELRGSTPGQAALYWNAAVVAEAQGRLGDAVHFSQRALALMSEQNGSRDLGALYVTCAQLLVTVDPGQAAQAVRLLEQALPLLKDFASDSDLGAWEGTRAAAALALGEPVAAEDFARQAIVTLPPHQQTERAQAQLSLGDALAVQGRTGKAEASYLAAYEVLRDGAAGRKAAVIWRQVADRLTRSGRPELALEAYQRALDTVGVRSAAPPAVAPASVPPATVLPAAGEQPMPWSTSGTTARSGSVVGA